MSKLIRLNRKKQNDKQTLGFMTVVDENGFPLYADITLELGWHNNQSNISCIPIGTYNMKLTYSPRFKKKMWLVENVPGRSGIRIHAANYYYQLEGCIAPGIALQDINGDDLLDVTNSQQSLQLLNKALDGDENVMIQIINDFPTNEIPEDLQP